MQNPNATVAAVSAAITVAAQWLVQKYAHVALTGYWATAVTSSSRWASRRLRPTPSSRARD